DPTWIRGLLFGSALRFDGNDLVRITTSPSLNTSNVTATAWVRGSSSPGQYKYVLGKGAHSQCRSADYGIYTGASGGIQFYSIDARNPAITQISGAVDASRIWDGRWHFVAGTYDGATAKLYVDGRLISGSTDVWT